MISYCGGPSHERRPPRGRGRHSPESSPNHSNIHSWVPWAGDKTVERHDHLENHFSVAHGGGDLPDRVNSSLVGGFGLGGRDCTATGSSIISGSTCGPSTSSSPPSRSRRSRRASRRSTTRRPTGSAPEPPRGHYTRSEFLVVCAWKSPRSRPRVQANSARAVRAATSVALRPGSSRQARMEPCSRCRASASRTASTLLWVAFPADYPILDVRALHALGHKPRGTYPDGLLAGVPWRAARWRRQHGVSLRTLDKALWQWSRSSPGRSPDAARARLGGLVPRPLRLSGPARSFRMALTRRWRTRAARCDSAR